MKAGCGRSAECKDITKNSTLVRRTKRFHDINGQLIFMFHVLGQVKMLVQKLYLQRKKLDEVSSIFITSCLFFSFSSHLLLGELIPYLV